MVGQGSPSTGRTLFASWIGKPARYLIRLVLIAQLVLFASVLAAAEPTMQLRVAWAGGAERQWNGSISITAGTLALVRPLGIMADAPGSIWADGNARIEIRERSPRSYDGLDLDVTASADAKLIVSLAADGDPRPTVTEVSVADLAGKMYRRALDNRDNQLVIRRSPGDQLEVETDRDQLVFSPGELWQLAIHPRLTGVAAGTTVYVKTSLATARGGADLSSQEQTVNIPASGATPALPLDVKLPNTEGVYDLVIEASERATLRWPKSLAQRRVQVIVVDSRATAVAADSGADWTQILEIDPANPRWYDRLKSLPRIPNILPAPLGSGQGGIWQGPLGDGTSQNAQHPLGRIVQLGSGGQDPNISWQAYPLSVAKPGTPHILEVEYPSDVVQTLGISVVEPNAAGAVAPIGLDSGFFTAEEPIPSAPRWVKHRILFWPRTTSPLVLLTNRRDGTRASYGKIRLYSGPARLPRAFPLSTESPERLLAGYLSRPLFAANFSATESLDAVTGRSLSDWQTFYEGGTRLADYLNHVGYNGLMLAVLSEGGTIYPSKLLDPTPRFDTGAIFDSGQDPVQKDVLEMLLRLFDRENLKLIPALEFSTPLPELEALLRDGGKESVGVQWVGPQGTTWTEVYDPRHGLAPYYNPLNGRVQQAMINVVRELVQRYGNHPSFAGLAVELSANGYAQLPGEAWGLDDDTIAQFRRATRLDVPGSGPDRFAERAKFVAGPGRAAWLQWRAEELAQFHHRLRRELAQVRPDSRLYLAAADSLDNHELDRDLRPGLPAQSRIEDALYAVGIQADAYRDDGGIVLLRPQRILPPGQLTSQGIDIEANRSLGWDRIVRQSATPGSLLTSEPQWARLASFDAVSPFGKDKSFTWLVSQLSPSQQRNRQRFIHSLATLDSQAIFDGGWLLPLGQEDALAGWVAAYRLLPAARFETVPGATDPVTIRTLTNERGTYAYLVNDSPFAAKASVEMDAPSGPRPQELGGQHAMDWKGTTWTVHLDPYDLVIVRFRSADVKLSSPVVDLGDEVRAALETSLRDLRSRRIVLESPPPLGLLTNPGFEQPQGGPQIPGWSLVNPSGGQAVLDSRSPHSGRQSLHMVSAGPAVSLRSDPFAVPKTGRLSVSVWLRTEDAAGQPPLRLVLEGLPEESRYYRAARLGAGQAVQIPNRWKQYIFAIDDLPGGELSQLRFRIDLVGAGQVSIDDVFLFDLVFTESEKIQLTKIVALADFDLSAGKLAECQYELEGYWPRFLLAHVPFVAQPVQQTPIQPLPAVQPAPAPPTAKPGVVDRIKDLWKL